MTVTYAAIAVVFLAALATLLSMVARIQRRAGRIDSAEDAAAAVEDALPGFAVAGAVVGGDASGALTVATDDRVAVVRRTGSRYRVVEVDWRAVRSTPEGIVIETADRRIGTVLLSGVDALDIRRLTAREAVAD